MNWQLRLTPNNGAPSFEMDYSCRSIAFGARELIVYSAKSNGVVGRVYEKAGVKKKIADHVVFYHDFLALVLNGTVVLSDNLRLNDN